MKKYFTLFMKRRNYALFLVLFLLAACTTGKEDTSFNFTTTCNPVDLSYRFALREQAPYWREAADPSIINFKGEYYLFLSKSGGYFHSTDLVHWDLIASDDLPIEKYAPTIIEMDGEIYFTASVNTNVVYKTADPKSGKWELVTDKFPYVLNDPMLFYDADIDRLFMYSGSGAATPITVMELDKKTFMPKAKPTELFYADADKYGWEVAGDYNTHYSHTAWLEGVWVSKYNGKYYLQYAVPGTEFKSYNNGVYISDDPMGPFSLAKHNPFSYKPEGFANGLGHGSTFQDIYGNYWNTGTATISQRHMFERRISLYPVFFDKDDEMYAYSAFGDYPMMMPGKKISSLDELFPGWMLLSYNKNVSTSSTLNGYPAENAVNEDIRTWWSAETGNKGEFLSIDLGEAATVCALQVNFADQDATQTGRDASVYYQYRIEGSKDGKQWNMLVDKSANTADASNDYTQLNQPADARYIRITNLYYPSGKFSISGLRVFGKMDKPLPAAAELTSLVRNEDNRRSVHLTWNRIEGATGYNIRFGTAKDKLYHNYMVYDNNQLDINILNVGQSYYFAMDSFNEAGITKGTDVKEVK
ncbi:family 43 glycosylhydrolase [Bacteroides sp. 51]|uniref:family 43 glycosylhydrolase n=1 Tax=Bacteroides sp. 51 TaxID=2302938 RepID=UPI001EF28930|nr:family 43 glycosylhydrolase [Bacteroides sp. 51]